MNDNVVRKVMTYRWAIFWVMAVAFMLVYFHRLCPAVVALDLQKTFGASAGLMGILASAYFYPYALMQLPAGLLSDSIGPRKTVSVFLAIAGVGSIILGMASEIGVAIAARVMVGVGVSMVFVPALKILSQWFRLREFAFMLALINIMGGLGALTAATPLALMTGLFGWRGAFEIIGCITLFMAALVWAVVRNRPRDCGWPSLAEIDEAGSVAPAQLVTIPLWEGARKVVTEKYFWPVAVWFFCVNGIYFGFCGLWAGPYLTHSYGFSREEVGSILNMIAVGLIVGSPFLSMLSDRAFHSRKKVMMLVTAVMVGEFLLLSLFPSDLSRPILYAAIFLITVCSAAIVVIGFSTVKELFPVEMAGTSVGMVNIFPFLGGAIFQPVLGWILEVYPRNASGGYSVEAYQTMLVVLVGAGAVGLISTFFMKETFPGSG